MIARQSTRHDDPLDGSKKWLLALWQISKRTNWSIWRNRSPISLEYVSEAGSVRYQCHFEDRVLLTATHALLTAHFEGLETESCDDVFNCLKADQSGVSATFQFRSPGWIELPKDVSPSGVAGILGVLSALGESEAAVVQMFVAPTWMTTDDGRQPAFWLAGRIAVASQQSRIASERLSLIKAALGQFSGFNGFTFSAPGALNSHGVAAVESRRWPRRFLPGGPPATAAQIASLYHPPEQAPATVHAIRYRRTPAPDFGRGVLLGEGRDASRRPRLLRVPANDLLRHAAALGPSGSGKTTFLANLAGELAQDGHGLTVLDPHGGLVKAIARTLPADRARDACLIRFSDIGFPVCINPFRAAPGQEFLAADEVVEVIQRVYGHQYWGPLLDLMLRHAAIATIELGGSLVDAARLLDDPWFRDKALSRLQNTETARFLGRLSESDSYDRRFLPALQRLQRFLATPWLRNILGQTTRGLDFRDIFRRREIVLIDLSGIGGVNAKLLGSLILLMLRQATFGRSGTGNEAANHFVLVDEASWFVSKTVAELFDQARKFGVGLILALQRLGQLNPEEVRDAVLANAGTMITFRISDRDEATYLARRLASESVDASDLQHLGRYEAYAQLTHDGERLDPAWFRPPAASVERADANSVESQLMHAARERYARPREEVEAALRERERAFTDDEEPEVRRLSPPATAIPAYSTRPTHP